MRPRSTFSRLGVFVLAAMLLTACTVPGTGDDTPATVPAPSGAREGYLESGCWTPDQVETTEGDETVPAKQYSAPPAMALEAGKTYTATIETNYGVMEFSFFPEDAPITVNNFICLAKDGYFDDTVFHRIIKGFVIQGGDPTGTGAGSPGYRFNDEPVKKDYLKGILAMANAGPNTNGSQFFIVLGDLRQSLPKNYTIFGEVTAGMDVVDAIAAVPVQRGRSGEASSPVEPVKLIKATVSEK